MYLFFFLSKFEFSFFKGVNCHAMWSSINFANPRGHFFNVLYTFQVPLLFMVMALKLGEMEGAEKPMRNRFQ